MPGEIEERLAANSIQLPIPASPVANYRPFIISSNSVYVSGQLPMVDGNVKYPGRVGETVTVEDGTAAARLCGFNLIAQVKAACGGDLDRVRRCVRLGGFVNSVPDFLAHPAVVDGASNLMVEVFGEKGAHARFAVGVNSLPYSASVEVDGIFEIDPPPA